jgi:hypothetical protein
MSDQNEDYWLHEICNVSRYSPFLNPSHPLLREFYSYFDQHMQVINYTVKLDIK